MSTKANYFADAVRHALRGGGHNPGVEFDFGSYLVDGGGDRAKVSSRLKHHLLLRALIKGSEVKYTHFRFNILSFINRVLSGS